MIKILLTTTSFQDTPGKHHKILSDTRFKVETLRGPVKENVLLPLIQKYDGIICGDDEITEEVLKKGREGNLRMISKYGVGLDKINLKAAKECGIHITNTPGINQISVAEHTIALLLCYFKNIHIEYNITKKGKWKRLIGHELYGKNMGILGLGKIGREVAIRAKSLGLNLYSWDINFDNEFVNRYNIRTFKKIENIFNYCYILSLHLPLNSKTKGIISKDIIQNHIKKGTVIINTARGKLIDLNALIWGLKSKIIKAYLCDVLDKEPIERNHPLLTHKNVIITPHIASRTYESVERQGIMAVQNLSNFFKDKNVK
ncbi:MAG: hypothetical protein KAT68_16100 [Bacteroidales bacterium]|nr:hypothetical protein [Bacteroidales bacterium]